MWGPTPDWLAYNIFSQFCSPSKKLLSANVFHVKVGKELIFIPPEIIITFLLIPGGIEVN